MRSPGLISSASVARASRLLQALGSVLDEAEITVLLHVERGLDDGLQRVEVRQDVGTAVIVLQQEVDPLGATNQFFFAALSAITPAMRDWTLGSRKGSSRSCGRSAPGS